MTFDPISVEVTCVTQPKDHFYLSPIKICWSMWICDPFFPQKLEPKVNDQKVTFDPSLLRSHVWLYPRIIMSKSLENTSKYADTVTLFSKTWTKGHWPLDDLWPHICWGHMCHSTQRSLCLSSMGIHQCRGKLGNGEHLSLEAYRPFSHCIDQAGLGAFTAKSGCKHYNPPPLTVMWMNFDSPNFPSFCSLSAIISFQTCNTNKCILYVLSFHKCIKIKYKMVNVYGVYSWLVQSSSRWNTIHSHRNCGV